MATTSRITLLVISLILLSGFSSVSASPPARIVAGIVTNVVSTLFKWLWSLRTPIKTEKAIMNRSTIKFEGGYTLDTVFDGTKVGIEPYSVQATPTGELLILDSSNSNLYRISTPLSRYSRPKIVTGSPEGYTGHVDGKLREAKMYHPKGIAIDDSGNIYIADAVNMAIRKITDAGITTIAGGKWSHGDGSSEDAKLSDDFDVVYIRSSCSLLVTDRGNQAIREIRLHHDDCSYEHPQVQPVEGDQENLHLGIAVLGSSIFFGYMLALLKQRVQSLFSSKRGRRPPMNNQAIMAPYQYQRPQMLVRPPLMPDRHQHNADEYEDGDEDEGLFFSFGRLIINASSSVAELFAGILFSRFRKKRTRPHNLHLNRHPVGQAWPNMHPNFAFRGEDEPPPPALEPRSTTPPDIIRKTYENSQQQFRQDGPEFHQQQVKVQKKQQQQQQQPQQVQQQKKQVSGNTKGVSEEKGTEKSEIVFGAVQEQDGRRKAMVIKAVDFSDPMYNQHNVRPRLNYMGYSAYSYS